MRNLSPPSINVLTDPSVCNDLCCHCTFLPCGPPRICADSPLLGKHTPAPAGALTAHCRLHLCSSSPALSQLITSGMNCWGREEEEKEKLDGWEAGRNGKMVEIGIRKPFSWWCLHGQVQRSPHMNIQKRLTNSSSILNSHVQNRCKYYVTGSKEETHHRLTTCQTELEYCPILKYRAKIIRFVDCMPTSDYCLSGQKSSVGSSCVFPVTPEGSYLWSGLSPTSSSTAVKHGSERTLAIQWRVES